MTSYARMRAGDVLLFGIELQVQTEGLPEELRGRLLAYAHLPGVHNVPEGYIYQQRQVMGRWPAGEHEVVFVLEPGELIAPSGAGFPSLVVFSKPAESVAVKHIAIEAKLFGDSDLRITSDLVRDATVAFVLSVWQPRELYERNKVLRADEKRAPR